MNVIFLFILPLVLCLFLIYTLYISTDIIKGKLLYILFSIGALIPIFSWGIFVVLCIILCITKINNQLKYNKITNFLFGIKQS